MKMILVNLLVVLAVQWSLADGKYSRGSLEVGGSVGVGHTDTTGTQIDLSPRVQYFPVDNLAFGLTLDFSKNDESEELGVGPSLTYYLSVTEQMTPFISQSILYKNYSGPLADGDDGLYATTSVGLNYPLGGNTAMSVSYQKLYSVQGDKDAESSESLSWGIRSYFK